MNKTLEQLTADYYLLDIQYKELKKRIDELEKTLAEMETTKPKPRVWSSNGKTVQQLTEKNK